jgi:hypothetical protein
MIPGPTPTSDCYLTDQREVSSDIGASSLMQSVVEIRSAPNGVVMTVQHRCDASVEIDCEDGEVESRGIGDTSRMYFQLSPGSSLWLAVIAFKGAASNPCSPAARLFGDIDYHGNLTVPPHPSSDL